MGDHAEGLVVSARMSGTRGVVGLDGDLDLLTAPALSNAIGGLVDVGATDVRVDGGSVSFADASGLNALLRARHDAGRRGATVEVVNASPRLQMVLELGGVAGVITAEG